MRGRAGDGDRIVREITLNSSPDIIKEAVQASCEILEQGGLIVAPTETAYGLLAHAEDKTALNRLFEFKQRPMDKPTAVFIESSAELPNYDVELDDKLLGKINRFWPGPVTFVMKSNMKSWQGVLSEEGKIGFRCSSHPFIKSLTANFRKPISATSANISGKIPESISEIEDIFEEKIELFIIDPLLKFNSLTSTVVEIMKDSIRILRKGAVDPKLIEETFAYE
ncbi:MAG: threonylcarbamoyl-AMP synthase [candidate division Zixibacteria bacterium]|nr:threonylcarbamoyl-AMP synthase [candidate division Zixibacteria bacterium]